MVGVLIEIFVVLVEVCDSGYVILIIMVLNDGIIYFYVGGFMVDFDFD